MANVLIMDDEPLSLRRLFNALCDDRRYDLSTADSIAVGVKVVERLGGKLDFLVIDVSMLETAAVVFLDLFTRTCPEAKMLVITPRLKPLGEYPQLRKPFTDQDFVNTVNEVGGIGQAGIKPNGKPKPLHVHHSNCRLVQVRASGQ